MFKALLNSDSRIGVLFGICSWAVLFGLLLGVLNPPAPRCPYCDRENNRHSQHEQNDSNVLPVSPSLKVGIGVGDSEKPNLQAEQAAHNEYHRLQAAFDNWRIEPNWLQFGVAALALLIAILQAGLFISQLRKMDESLKASEDTRKEMIESDQRQLRAYVSIRMSFMRYLNDSGNSPTFKFTYTNHGKTPARAVQFRAILDVCKKGITGPQLAPFVEEWPDGAFDLFPNSEEDRKDRIGQTFNTRRPITEEETERIRKGEAMFVVRIQVRYLTVFADTKSGNSEYKFTECAFTPYFGKGPRIGRVLNKEIAPGIAKFAIIPDSSRFT